VYTVSVIDFAKIHKLKLEISCLHTDTQWRNRVHNQRRRTDNHCIRI